MVKVDSLGCIEPGCDVILGITSFITNLRDAISVYPNPAHESVLVGIDLPSNFKPDGSLRLSLVNEQGVLVKEQRIANMATVVFDLGGVASGLYTLHLSDNSQWIACQRIFEHAIEHCEQRRLRRRHVEQLHIQNVARSYSIDLAGNH